MPVINIDLNDLRKLVGEDLSLETFTESIPLLGASIEEIEGDSMQIEFFPDRPDLYSVEGVARALRAFLGIKPGLMEYPTKDSGIEFRIDASVNEVRPYAAAGVIRGVELNDNAIKSIMEIQEKLHITLGRKRKKVAIGIHDMKHIVPPFKYQAVGPEEVHFVPLASDEEMTPKEILEKHPKGIDYAGILEGKEKYPLITDSRGQVLSFPPIINGSLTTVTEDTTDIFLDITGTDFHAVEGALNIVAAALVERGGRIETVRTIYDSFPEGGEIREMVLPDMSPKKWEVPSDYIVSIIGEDTLKKEQIIPALKATGMSAVEKGDNIEVSVPAYRLDIIHPIDIVEDVAIGYGYHKIEGGKPAAFTVGEENAHSSLSRKLRELMVGYGYLEVTTLTLSSPEIQFDSMRRERPTDFEITEIKNPITEEHTCLRTALTPDLFVILRKNRHRDLPQRIFEVGSVVRDHKRQLRIAGLAIHAKAGFTEMKSLVISLCRDMGLNCEIEPSGDPAFIRGRGAAIMVEGKEIGTFGEFHPEVITNFELGYPVIGFEMALSGTPQTKD